MKKIALLLGGLLSSLVLAVAQAHTPGFYVNFGGGYTDFTASGTNFNYSTNNIDLGIGYLSAPIDQLPLFWGVQGDINYNVLMLNLAINGILGLQFTPHWSAFGKAGISANYIAVIGDLPSLTRPQVGGGIAFQATQHIRFTGEIERVFLTGDIGFTNYNLNIQFSF